LRLLCFLLPSSSTSPSTSALALFFFSFGFTSPGAIPKSVVCRPPDTVEVEAGVALALAFALDLVSSFFDAVGVDRVLEVSFPSTRLKKLVVRLRSFVVAESPFDFLAAKGLAGDETAFSLMG
jgi:hypothetical protein